MLQGFYVAYFRTWTGSCGVPAERQEWEREIPPSYGASLLPGLPSEFKRSHTSILVEGSYESGSGKGSLSAHAVRKAGDTVRSQRDSANAA